MEDLYSIIGKLYVDIFQAQKYISMLQDENKEKDKTIAELRIELKKLDDRQ
jgi:hypothetical protein